MKISKRTCIDVIAVFSFLLLLVGCSSTEEAGTSLGKMTMYPVKITRVSTNDDSGFVISGTTDAPEGAKIFAKSPVNVDTDNEANPANSDNDSYEKVSSNGKFKIIINSEHLKTSGEKLKIGQTVQVKIFAVTGYKEKFEDADISGNLSKLLKKSNVKWTNLKVDKKIHSQSKDSDKVIDKKNEDIMPSSLKIYPVQIVKTETDDDGNFILSGSTTAPTNAKLFAQASKFNEEVDIASQVDNDETYPKVKNGKFQIILQASDIFEDTDKIKDGATTNVKIFAVTGYNLPYEDAEIHGGLLQALKKANISNISMKADKKIADYWKDDDSSDSNNSKSDTKNNKSSSDDSSKQSSKSRSKANDSKQEKINIALQILQKNYAGQASVEYKDKMFEIKPNFDGASNIVLMVKSGDRETWDKLTNSIDKVSKTLYEDIELDIPVAIVNPANSDKVLYTSLDGESVYNFADDN